VSALQLGRLKPTSIIRVAASRRKNGGPDSFPSEAVGAGGDCHGTGLHVRASPGQPGPRNDPILPSTASQPRLRPPSAGKAGKRFTTASSVSQKPPRIAIGSYDALGLLNVHTSPYSSPLHNRATRVLTCSSKVYIFVRKPRIADYRWQITF
jgi:hypothetical protein